MSHCESIQMIYHWWYLWYNIAQYCKRLWGSKFYELLKHDDVEMFIKWKVEWCIPVSVKFFLTCNLDTKRYHPFNIECCHLT